MVFRPLVRLRPVFLTIAWLFLVGEDFTRPYCHDQPVEDYYKLFRVSAEVLLTSRVVISSRLLKFTNNRVNNHPGRDNLLHDQTGRLAPSNP